MLIADADLIVPVPLHWRRLWWRRFNQSAALARRLPRRARRACRARRRSAQPADGNQVGLGRQSAEPNVRGAFGWRSRKRIEMAGGAVLLVDDVYTTGATVKAVTRALMRAGAGAVDVLVFARVARRPTERSIRTVVQLARDRDD